MKLEMDVIEKLAELNRKKIPERMFFAKGAGAHGVFTPYMSMKDHTMASFLQDTEKETPIFVRFSNELGSRGSADTLRNIRGFATRFFTEQGDYDLLCCNLPVFFVKDPAKTTALIKALQPSAHTNLADENQFWRFIAEHPETVHLLLHLYSDQGTIKSYRHMQGYSVNTYLWLNRQGETSFVRYHWKPVAGIKSIPRQEAEFLAGFDPDTAARNLYEALEQGEEISYELSVQMVKTNEKYRFDFDLLDVTKVWPEQLIPPVTIGKLTLNQLPQDYEREVEKTGFHPANLISGIALSADPMLQTMCFVCSDAQRYRLGALAGSRKIEVGNGQLKEKQYDTKEICYKQDDFSQPRQYYHKLKDQEKNHLIDNLLDRLMFAEDEIQERVVGHLSLVDEELGAIVAMGLNF